MKTFLLAATLALAVTSAHAQTLTDTFGRTVTCVGAGPVTCTSSDGLVVTQPTSAQAITTLDGMAPASYVPPAVSLVPASVQMWQLQIAMAAVPSKINAAPATVLSDANALATATGGTTLIAWQHAATVDRTSPTIAAMAPALGLSSGDIDTLFIAAAQVVM